MSDNEKSLEDFFAKKTKVKKGKGKSKFTTSDAITKQVAGSSQKESDSRSKDQPTKKNTGVAPAPSHQVRIFISCHVGHVDCQIFCLLFFGSFVTCSNIRFGRIY